MSKIWSRSASRYLPAAMLVLAAAVPALAKPNLARGAVYVMSNLPAGNSVLVFRRAADGVLTAAGTYATGGKGNGTGTDPLGSQGGLVLSGGHLFAVNAGSNDISVFTVGKQSLSLVQRIASGGSKPTSLAVWNDLLYVLDAGSGTITGFHVAASGELSPLAGSTRALTGGTTATPSQIGWKPDGSALLVDERGPQIFDVFPVDEHGIAGAPTPSPAQGAGPFGFAFGRRGTLVGSEAGVASASSYEVGDDGLTVISGSVASGEKATCWLAIAGRHVFTANAGTGTISRYLLASDGTLTLEDAHAATFDDGNTPLDMAVAGNGGLLYVSLEKRGAVAGFRIEADGTLVPAGSVTGLPPYFQGIAAE